MLSHKEYIYEVYKQQSFSKAARKMYVSQPWLSSVVKSVEEKIGVPLFNRKTTPISLTEAGRYYIEKVEEIMAIEEEMTAYFEMLKKDQMHLNIGSSMFFSIYVLPLLVTSFQEENPDIVISFSEGDHSNLVEKLVEGKIDFLLETEKVSENQIESIVWSEERLVLAVPTELAINEKLKEYGYTYAEFKNGSHKIKKPPVNLSEFADEKFIFLEKGNDLEKRSSEMCRNSQFKPDIAFYVPQMMTAYLMTQRGYGVTILREAIFDYMMPTDKITIYKINDALAIRPIYLSYKKSMKRDIDMAFKDFMITNSVDFIWIDV